MNVVSKTILIVDDDIYIGNLIEEALVGAGYAVRRAYSGTEAVYVLNDARPDLVLLDLMLPGLSGEEILPRFKDIPVIILSAKADVDGKVALLLNGAADYVTKPFNIKELLARIAVCLRGTSHSASEGVLSFDGVRLHTDTHIVEVDTVAIKLTRTEYAILKTLMLNRHRIVSKSVLLDCIADDTPDCTESSLKTHISHLRAKLSEVNGRDYIETVWGIGFKMKEPDISTKSQPSP